MAQVMYERLERYDENTGEFKGAHVKLYDNVSRREGDAMSYATAAAAGFTATDILTQVEMGAILAAQEAQAALTAEQAAHAATKAEVDMLRAQIALLQP